jgi:hypothetical protein
MALESHVSAPKSTPGFAFCSCISFSPFLHFSIHVFSSRRASVTEAFGNVQFWCPFPNHLHNDLCVVALCCSFSRCRVFWDTASYPIQ